MAVKSIGLSKAGGRKPCTLLDAARHNLREIQAELGACGRINPTLSHTNEVLAGPADAAGVQALAQRVAAAAGVDPAKLRRDHVQAVELVFSLPADTTLDVGHYFRRCLAWVNESFTGVKVLQAVSHRDESTPHCHVLLAPYKGGRHVGSSLIDRKALSGLKESHWRNVAGPAGLKRAGAKLYGQAKRTVADAVLARLELLCDPVLQSAVLGLVRRQLEADPLPFAEALGLELQGKGGSETRHPTEPAKPIEIEAVPPNSIGFAHGGLNPIEFAAEAAEDRTLSCVGFAHQTPQLDRLSIAREAAATAMAKHTKPKPVAVVDDDGLTREPDPGFSPDVWEC